ncbi:hypothetical protein [Streptomyces abyssomicinicus]|uniref:hypothetical protein n=1 Tax=Streptomyces abyssomicinicus TaxID=574929 RepID=UPI0015816BD1|nr:hypothetical protein [Streptomyces abyssomicinicus]
MRTSRTSRARAMAVAVAAGLLAGGTAAGASGAFTAAKPADSTTDTVVNAGSAAAQKKFYGTFQKRDGCPYLVTSGGARYYLEGYTIGGNGALYKKRGGFIAYPGWRIQANGTKKYRSPNSTTLCTTWGASPYIKAKSIYSLR